MNANAVETAPAALAEMTLVAGEENITSTGDGGSEHRPVLFWKPVDERGHHLQVRKRQQGEFTQQALQLIQSGNALIVQIPPRSNFGESVHTEDVAANKVTPPRQVMVKVALMDCINSSNSAAWPPPAKRQHGKRFRGQGRS